MLPAYMNELWLAYWQMSTEDRGAIDPALLSVDPLTCHEALLPYLASELGIDISGLDTATARSLLGDASNSFKNAGTIGSLKKSLASLGVAKVEEWFEYSGSPYLFKLRVDVNEHGLNETMLNRIESIALERKNARSQMEAIEIFLSSSGSQRMAATVQSGEGMSVYPYFPDPIEVSTAQKHGIGLHSIETIAVWPQGA